MLHLSKKSQISRTFHVQSGVITIDFLEELKQRRWETLLLVDKYC